MSKLIDKISLGFIVVLFTILLVLLGFASEPYDLFGRPHLTLVTTVLGAILVMYVIASKARVTPVSKLKMLFWFLAISISSIFATVKVIFGDNELDAILVFFRDNQVEDIARIGSDSFSTPIMVMFALILLLSLLSLLLASRVQKFDTLLAVFALILFALSPVALFIKNIVITNSLQADFKIDEEMGINIMDRPQYKKNIIIVYLESLERTYQDIVATKEAYRPLQDFSQNGLEATNVFQTVGTNYTIAGIVASQCGVPLVSQGLLNIFFKKKTEVSLDEFMPSVTCLGDILADDGYTLSYINGASLDRFSKRGFLTTHGYDYQFGLDEAEPDAVDGRQNVFGMNDALMFEYVHKEYDRLIAQDDPFVLTVLTLSTHGPDAFLDVDCPVSPPMLSSLPRAMECTLKLLDQFVKYTKAHGNGRDTEIVIMSDHLAMKNTLSEELQVISERRRNLFTIENDGTPVVVDRASTMMDIYPTLLEQLGYTLSKGKGNLGRSLFSEEQNLAERFGKAGLEKLLNGNKPLSDYIWKDIDLD